MGVAWDLQDAGWLREFWSSQQTCVCDARVGKSTCASLVLGCEAAQGACGLSLQCKLAERNLFTLLWAMAKL